MIKTRIKLILIGLYFLIPIIFILIQSSCNPACEPLLGLQVSPAVGVAGTEVIIKATPLESLISQDLTISFDNKPAKAKRFHPQLGLIVTVPDGIEGQVDLEVSNPDCHERLAFNAVTQSFFEKNKSFIPPAVPQIFIPISPLPAFPPSLENAWLSPANTDYCIWFKFLKDPKGKCTTSLDPTQSFEQSTCNGTNTSLLYGKNPIFGVLDKDRLLVHFWIDRSKNTNGNLGIEEFKGYFINVNDTPYKKFESLACGGSQWKEERNHMIVATSQTTGRQLLIYQQAFKDPNFLIDCK